jgi:ribonuclease T1
MSQTGEPKQPSRNPLVTIGVVIVVGLIAFYLWQSGSFRGVQPVDDSVPSAATAVTQEIEPTTVAAESPDATEASEALETSEASDEPVEAEGTPTAEPAQQVSDLPPIAYLDLPPEAHDTIELIDSDGPYPFSKDGSTFQNREGILPDMPQGYYAEFTVITPGSDDRGARRIVAGEEREMYYTDDHYASFKEIIR